MRSLLSLSFLFISGVCFPQNTLEGIDMDKIPQKKIRSLIRHQVEDIKISNFNQLQGTFHDGESMAGYHMLESVYLIKKDPETVWKTYQVTSPAESWHGRMVSFGLLISKGKNSILYPNDPYFAGIDTGQVFYVNLKILNGLYNLAVGLEIMSIDTVNKSIKFSYLKGGISRGEQMIYFIPTKKGYTQIVHRTAFRSDSFLRDRYLYPYFHRIAINEFHKNMKKRIPGEHKILANYVE
jgi:hypothetical protein